MTKAESKYTRYYHIGDTIQPQQDYIKTGLKSQELCKIEAIDVGNHLTVCSESGKLLKFSPMIHRKLISYCRSKIEISKDDVLRACIERHS